ncbi:Alpha-lytic protease prodomain-containing protein [Actinacidiphila yanglinensis]|uniref:Alpha-lytic protease prodomain-containing protein n=1 Tax=Actinacidiphila yanglinensis TaxID=310779 RepID=A0A1H6DAD9_9ACTN|nr:S1 family peptidase [Actinacidiphila yanglinensis]SEG82152.1 Alpha-lytic protease prodomain-containing protein [Actinacidiphila yanglinensis]
MRRRIGTIISLSALLVATALGGAGVMTASAAPAPDAGSSAGGALASDAVVTAMVHDLGLTPAQARQRLRQQATATTLEPKARKAAGSSYGGSWFDQRDGTLVVAVTGARAASAVARTGAATTVVARTAKQLDAAKSAIDTLARTHKAPAGVSSWGVDLQKNQVVVSVRADRAGDPAVRAFVAAAERGDTAQAVTVRTTAAAAPTTLSAGTVGGDPFTSHGIRCSIGFSVIGGFVTAGHCSQAGAAVYGWDGSYVGNFQAGTFPGNDYSWVNVGSGWWTVNVVLGWGTVSDVLVHGSAVAPVGSSVCRSGSTTHWHCGTILGTNETVNYSEGSVYGLTETNVCAEPGDSGGSFISGDQAQGVTSGGYGDCTSGGETWFQPVNPILSAYGLTLQTS